MLRSLIVPGLLVGLALSLPAGADPRTSPLLGRLLVKGHASVESPSGSVELADTVQPYFAGDRIAAGADGVVVLTLEAGSLTVEPGAAARVGIARSVPQVSLDRGTARIQFAAGRPFELALGELRVRPRLDAGGASAIDALVSFDPGQGAVVGSRAGVLEAFAPEAASGQAIAAGETRGFPLAAGRALPDVAAGTSDPGLDERMGEIGLRIAGFAGLAGLGYGAVELADDEGDGSPTR